MILGFLGGALDALKRGGRSSPWRRGSTLLRGADCERGRGKKEGAPLERKKKGGGGAYPFAMDRACVREGRPNWTGPTLLSPEKKKKEGNFVIIKITEDF